MCTDVVVHSEPTVYCSNQGELAEALGGDLVHDSGYADNAYQPDMCLCPIDLEATAQKHGYTPSWYDSADERDPFSIHFYKEPV